MFASVFVAILDLSINAAKQVQTEVDTSIALVLSWMGKEGVEVVRYIG